MRETMLILHFIGLAMGIGTSIGFMFLSIASSKMEKKDASKFQINTLALGKMGHIGIGILIVTGGYLMTPHWKFLGDSPLLIIKFCLVLILAALIGKISSLGKKAKKGDPELYFKKIEPLGKLSLIIGLAIIVMAVTHFR